MSNDDNSESGNAEEKKRHKDGEKALNEQREQELPSDDWPGKGDA